MSDTNASQPLSEPVTMRGHHLLCMLGFKGKGYTEAFVEMYADMIAKINRGATIKIVDGPDDICNVLVKAGEAVCSHARVCVGDKIKASDALALQEISTGLGKPTFKPGDVLTLNPGDIQKMRELFADGAIRSACQRCAWRDLCSQISTERFDGVQLFPNARPLPSPTA